MNATQWAAVLFTVSFLGLLNLIAWESYKIYKQQLADIAEWKSRAEKAEKELAVVNRFKNVELT